MALRATGKAIDGALFLEHSTHEVDCVLRAKLFHDVRTVKFDGTRADEKPGTDLRIGEPVASEPCDLRKGFNGLYGMVSERLGEDPRGGALFVFSNRCHSRIKVLYFDGTGLWVLTKRLEKGTFSWPRSTQGQTAKLKLTPEAFGLLTNGVDLRGARLRAWYERE